MLEVLDGEAKRLVALQEAIEHRPSHQPDVRPAALRGDPAVQVVPGGQRAQFAEHPRNRLGGLVEKLARGGSVEGRRQPAEALHRLAAGQIELTIATVLGRVKGHGGTVVATECSQSATVGVRVLLCRARVSPLN